MNILGISGGFRQGYQDVSATLIIDGKVIGAIEEERLNRIKFSAGRLPFLSVNALLQRAKLQFSDLDRIAFHGSTWGNEIDDKIREFYFGNFGFCPPIERYHHHDCHAASSYFASNFDDALIVTADNSGDGVSLQIAVGQNGRISIKERFARPNSFGLFYQLITQICGYTKDCDEYKVMGLSSYGDGNKYDLSQVLQFEQGNIVLNPHFIKVPKPGEPSLHKDELAYTSNFEALIQLKRRTHNAPITQEYKDLAASAQKQLETVFKEMTLYYLKKYDQKNLCLAGGVALNCVINQQLNKLDEVANIFIQPAASDAGISLGAAWLSSQHNGFEPIATTGTYLGLDYSPEEIEKILRNCGLRYLKLNDPADTGASLLAENKVIGWFQGRSEFGPRALGNRSILANPCTQGMQQHVNQKIKFRESFRPFAPSVLEEDAPLYFSSKNTISPYMTRTFDATEFAKKNVHEIVHVDGTSRIQTVNCDNNPLFYKLIRNFKLKSGHGVVMNTSFNLSHEPIVESPIDAIATFFASGLDALIIGNFLVTK